MADVGRDKIVAINQKGWNTVAPQFYGGTALPKYGPLAGTEDDLRLIDNLKGKAVLEIGCGSGHTLAYLAKVKEAGEVWGVDLSQEQIRFSREHLEREKTTARLFLASMDENPGIPEAHFDWVFSIYSLGWTPDLGRTLALVHSYLKPGGKFLFSWEHPVYQCLEYRSQAGEYAFARPYLQEGPEIDPSWKGVEIVLHPRTLSTYLNGIVEAGLVLEKVIESEVNLDQAREKDLAPERWYSVPRARLMPTTFIVKAGKPA
ncbi:MAG TPA: class I SAM-dependent methyltransferase [Anaerolineales bacterium]|nr:class I SAM-dependent methyltransferase [Anaerolineales bacterium]